MRHSNFIYAASIVAFIACSTTTYKHDSPKQFTFLIDTLYEGGMCLAHNVAIYSPDNELIYTDSDNYYIASECPYLCYSPENSEITYIMMNTFDPIFSKSMMVLQYDGHKLSQYPHCIDKRYITDIDEDGYYEVIGKELTEAYSIDVLDSSYYSPVEVYQLGKDSMSYREDLSSRFTRAIYGCFLGLSYREDTVLPYDTTIYTFLRNHSIEIHTNVEVVYSK